MNINELNLVNNQSLNFKSAKARALKSLNPKNFVNTTLQDKFNFRNKAKNLNTDNFVYAYDAPAKECEQLDENAAVKKQTDNYFSMIKAAIKQSELDKKTCNNFLEELAKYQKGIYQKLIARCFSDVDNAVLKDAPKAELDKLYGTLELFINKFGHYDRPL